MNENKKITMKIESNIKGHETTTLPVNEAIDRIDREISSNGKWLYCDGQYTNIDTVTESGKQKLQSVLQKSSDITLAGTLLGG